MNRADFFAFVLRFAAPGLACFAVGFVLALLDFHRTIIENGRGTAPITYVRSPASFFFCLIVAATGVAMFAYVVANPKSSFAGLFAFAGESTIALSICVSLATITLMRSKFAEIEGKKIGFEYVYDVYRSWAVKRYKTHSARIKRTFVKLEADRLVKQNINSAEFVRDIDLMINEAINSETPSYIERFKTEFSQIVKNQTVVPELHTIEHILSICIDHTNIRTTKGWIALYPLK